MDELRPGLWRWTAVHPAWEPAEAETPGDWPREVGAVAYAAPGALVLIDPLVGDDAWEPVDRLVDLRNGLTGEELRLLLSERLLHLPVELVLVSHGEPVREGAREALAVAL